MVPRQVNKIRNCIPVLGIIALLAIFLKLPEAQGLFSFLSCKACSNSNPYFPLAASGYFAALISISLLFPTFPNPLIARGGLIWSLLLAIPLTLMTLPDWCIPCLIAHACNVLTWTIWTFFPDTTERPYSTVKERLCLLLFGSVAVVAMFGSLNLTMLIYSLKNSPKLTSTSLKEGDYIQIPAFESRLVNDNIQGEKRFRLINFISQDCPYCQEQLAILQASSEQIGQRYKMIMVISPTLQSDLTQQFPLAEWIEDKEGKLRELFKVSGYPTLFVIDNDNKILNIISGASDQINLL